MDRVCENLWSAPDFPQTSGRNEGSYMLEVLRFHLALILICAACFGQSAPQAAPSAVAAPVTASPAVADNKPVPASTPNPLGEARILYRKGDFSGAIANYQEILKEQPKSPDAYAGLVRVYLKQKNVEEAAQTAELGLAHSDSPRIHVARAEVWFRQGRITDAEAEWVQVINAGFPEARAYLGLARVRGALAMYKTEKAMITKAHQLDPDDPDIQEAWANTLSRAERIQYLEAKLAGDNNWDLEEKQGVGSYLAYLKERAKQSASSCRLVSKVTATASPLVPLLRDAQNLRGYGLSVILNGHKSALLLDTGAGGILVKRSVAERAGISKIIETKIGGIGSKGQKNAYVGIADSVKIGELEFQNCPVEVIERGSLVGEDGLIGADVFEKFLVELDLADGQFRLSELPKRPGEVEEKPTLKGEDADSDDESGEGSGSAKEEEKSADTKKSASSRWQDRYMAPEMQSYTRVYRFGHGLLVPTMIGNVPAKLFLLDTGAFGNSISPAAAREVTKLEGDTHMTIKGISGSVDKVYSANKAVLQFGHLRQENQDMTAFDTANISEGVGTEVSGFLGFTMLRFLDIKIDYRDALVDFEYVDKAR
jgi:tetratricopeptide (TPR) repeat protein